MGSLTDKQARFTVMISQLISYADSLPGYQLTFGDAYRSPEVTYGHSESLHRSRLAVDFNLFVDGAWIDGRGDAAEMTEEWLLWLKLGRFWEFIGGTWGGRFTGPIARDMNHFSLAHGGMK